MKNEVFKRVAAAVRAFKTDYTEKEGAAEAQIRQAEAELKEAESRAAEAVAANDQAAWKEADKARSEAASEIKFNKERLEMIRRGKDLPLEDYNRLKAQIDAEQGRLTLDFVKAAQNHLREIMQAYEAMEAIYEEGTQAANVLYAVGGSPDDGYARIKDYQPSWRVLFRTGSAFSTGNLLDLDLDGAISGNGPVGRAVLHAREAVEYVKNQGGM